jgi:hypothetical protein
MEAYGARRGLKKIENLDAMPACGQCNITRALVQRADET